MRRTQQTRTRGQPLQPRTIRLARPMPTASITGPVSRMPTSPPPAPAARLLLACSPLTPSARCSPRQRHPAQHVQQLGALLQEGQVHAHQLLLQQVHLRRRRMRRRRRHKSQARNTYLYGIETYARVPCRQQQKVSHGMATAHGPLRYAQGHAVRPTRRRLGICGVVLGCSWHTWRALWRRNKEPRACSHACTPARMRAPVRFVG